jgi:hypothetical protein
MSSNDSPALREGWGGPRQPVRRILVQRGGQNRRRWPMAGTGHGHGGLGIFLDVRAQPQREVEADRWAATARGAHQAVAYREKESGQSGFVIQVGSGGAGPAC